jgi:hypothetical protein
MRLPKDISRTIPAIDPLNVTARVGGLADDPQIRGLTGTLSNMKEGWEKILTARDKTLADLLRTPLARLDAINDYAWKIAKPLLAAADSSVTKATAEVNRVDRDLDGALRQSANKPVATEIRQYVKTLSDEARSTFLMDAIRSGDDLTVGAVLAAPPYLSGLRPEAHAHLLQNWRRMRHPEETHRQAALRTAIDLVNAGGRAFLINVDHLVDGQELNKARKASQEAQDALKAG